MLRRILPRLSSRTFSSSSLASSLDDDEDTVVVKAVVCALKEGDNNANDERLRLKTFCVSPSALQRDEVLVEVEAFAVNPLDAMVADGKYLDALFWKRGSKRGEEKEVFLGKDFAGRIRVTPKRDDADVKVQSSSQSKSNRELPRIGDEVYGAIASADFNRGSFATHVVVKKKELMRKPKFLSFSEAAAIPFAAFAAYECLRLTGCVDRSEPKSVLLFGGGSSVGECAARIALRAGFANRVVATASQASGRFLKESVGVERVIEYSGENTSSRSSSKNEVESNYAAKNTRFVSGDEPSFDVAIDCVGSPKTRFQAMQSLRPGLGRYVTLHGHMAELVGKSGVIKGSLFGFLELLREKVFARLQYDVSLDWAHANPLDADASRLIERLVSCGDLSVRVSKDDVQERVGRKIEREDELIPTVRDALDRFNVTKNVHGSVRGSGKLVINL